MILVSMESLKFIIKSKLKESFDVLLSFSYEKSMPQIHNRHCVPFAV